MSSSRTVVARCQRSISLPHKSGVGVDGVDAPSVPVQTAGSGSSNATAIFYRDRAVQAEADANAATLDNVRTRWLRAAKAWGEMATRAEKTAERRSVNEEAKMIAEMMEDD